jgi:hypothetical protein
LAAGTLDRLPGQFILGGKRLAAGTLDFNRHDAKQIAVTANWKPLFCLAVRRLAIHDCGI